MDRLFLDANALFSAAYRPNPGLLKLWKLKNVILCSSRHALEEARINLTHEVQPSRLARLSRNIIYSTRPQKSFPTGCCCLTKTFPSFLPQSKQERRISLPATCVTLGPTSARKSRASSSCLRETT